MFARLRRGGAWVVGVDGAIEVCALRSPDGQDTLLLSLWPTLTEARADPTAEWYEVHTDQVRRGEPAEVAAVVRFGGPIWEPVPVPGDAEAIRAMTLWQPERLNQVIVMLAASEASIGDGHQVAGADQVDLYQVLSLQAGTPR
jgi:hypothetical protein